MATQQTTIHEQVMLPSNNTTDAAGNLVLPGTSFTVPDKAKILDSDDAIQKHRKFQTQKILAQAYLARQKAAEKVATPASAEPAVSDVPQVSPDPLSDLNNRLLNTESYVGNNVTLDTANSVFAQAGYTLSDNAIVAPSISEVADNKKAAVPDTQPLQQPDLTPDVSTYNINSIYSSGNGRLLSFVYNSGGDDDNKRAYLRLGGETEILKKTIMSTAVTYRQLMSIFTQLTTGYKAFILTNIQENLQEKQHVMPTVGDSFASTFAGADPQVMTFNGILPFDNRSDMSWFVHFMNMYVRFIRASVLAKYRCWLELVVPDYQVYRCYPISISCTLDSASDTQVSFGVSTIVANDWADKAYGYTATQYNVEQLTSETKLRNDMITALTGGTSNADKPTTATANNNTTTENQTGPTSTDAAASKQKEDEQSGADKNPKDIGEKVKKKNIFTSAAAFVKEAGEKIDKGLSKATDVVFNGKKQSVGALLSTGISIVNNLASGGRTKGRNNTLSALGKALNR